MFTSRDKFVGVVFAVLVGMLGALSLAGAEECLFEPVYSCDEEAHDYTRDACFEPEMLFTPAQHSEPSMAVV
jgi:hypothetical protein